MENLTLIKPEKVQNIINKFCYTIGMIPTSYKISLTYEEQILAIGKYLEETVIPALNNNAEAVAELQSLFVQLKNYVENYFDNLDVQEEINNKLDEMVQDGTLSNLISNILFGIVISRNVEEMKTNMYLKENDIVKTLGFYNENDNGSSLYMITSANLNENNSNIIKLNNNLFAVLLLNNNMNSKQFGIIGDGITNETEKLQNTFNLLVENFPNGFKLEIIGNVLLNAGIKLKDDNNLAKNITIFGNNSSVTYGSANYQNNGFTFIANQYTKTEALLVHNIKSLKIESLFFTTTDPVTNGGLPLNGLYGIRLKNSPFYIIENCNISKFFIGLFNTTGSDDETGSGLGKILRNNFSMNNVGMWLYNIGDTIIEDNYINTSGWNIYQDNYSSVKPEYNDLNTLGMVHGTAIYYVYGGNTQIKGGKIEYCLNGIYCERLSGILINNINFDACIKFAIGITNQNPTSWKKNNINITNCNFIGCGSNQYAGGYNASLNGCSIGLIRANWVNIGNNSFEGSNLNFIKGFTNNADKFWRTKIFIY